MSYVSHAPSQSRVFDPVYDPLFIVSSPKDAWRANTYALSKSAPIHVFTKYDVMFSDLPKESRSIYWQQQNLLPHFRLAGGGDATNKKATVEPINLDVTGKYRDCFFRYPPDGFGGNTAILNLQLNISDEREKIVASNPEENFKSAACQTCYRESSAQTHPYQPDAITGSGQTEEPELLRISKIISGDNQPGEFEAKIIERVRRRRKWEKELPALSTLEDLKKRAIVLEAFEWEEWMSREDEIEDIQKIRLELVYRLLEKRDRCFKLKSIAKLENSATRIEEKRKKNLEKVKKDHERQLRKLEAKHKNVSRKYKKGNIVEDHVDPSSELYGPQMRFGVNPNRRHYIGFRKKFCARLDDLDKKIKEQPSLICPMSKLTELAQPKEPQKEIKQGFRTDANLKRLYEALKNLRTQELRKGTPKCLRPKVEELDEISETPIGIEIDQVAEADYQSRVYLQKIIKGRAVQTMLFRGRLKYKDLLEEMHSTNFIPVLMDVFPDIAWKKNSQKELVMDNQKHLMQILKSEQEIKEVLSESEVKIISGLFDFLEKELKRLNEQKKMHAIYMLAEKERRRREAFEAGKRQRENQRREEHTEIYRNLTKSTQDTATLYLENIILEEAALKAERDSRLKIQAIAKRIDQAASKMKVDPTKIESQKLTLEDEDYIATLVNDFVFPEVQKQLARNRMELRRRKYVQAAHGELYQYVEDTFKKKIEPEPGPEMAENVLTDLIIKAVDSEAALSELVSTENIAHHEAISAVQKIIKRVLPGEPKWKSSAQRITSATISELTQIAVQSEAKEKESNENPTALQDIYLNLTTKLWEAAYDNAKQQITEQEKDKPKLKHIPQSMNLLTDSNIGEVVPRLDMSENTTPIFSESFLDALKLQNDLNN